MALGALIIKEKLGISDRETVEQIKENPYLGFAEKREKVGDRWGPGDRKHEQMPENQVK